eukprot:UN33721
MVERFLILFWLKIPVTTQGITEQEIYRGQNIKLCKYQLYIVINGKRIGKSMIYEWQWPKPYFELNFSTEFRMIEKPESIKCEVYTPGLFGSLICSIDIPI